MNILLVSDVHHFSTLDVYTGYKEAFDKLLPGSYDTAELHSLTGLSSLVSFTREGALGMMLTKLLRKDNNFTHVLFVSGLCIPSWVWESCYDKKVGVIACDDPHASKYIMEYKQHIHYWFTNEKKMEDKDNNIFYIPTATSSKLPVISKDEVPNEFKYDVVFIGTVYDDRIPVLEQACEYCESKNLSISIIGPLLKTPTNSIIRKYGKDGIINNDQTKMFYRGSNVVINIDRNINWNPNESDGNSLLLDVGEPYSMNPRAYEIAGCRTAQLFVNPRQEVADVFGDNVYTCGYDDIKEGLDKVFNDSHGVVLNKVNNCYNIVKDSHFYLHRASRVLNIIKSVDSEGEKNEI